MIQGGVSKSGWGSPTPISPTTCGFVFLVCSLMQFRSGGEWLLDDQVYLVALRPNDQLVVPVQDKGATRPASLCPFEDALAPGFFCYQLLTSFLFSVIRKSPSRAGAATPARP